MKIDIEGDSREAVAYALMHTIAAAEGKFGDKGVLDMNREEIAELFALCFQLVGGSYAEGIELGGDEDDEEIELIDDEDETDDEDEDGARGRVNAEPR